LISKPKNWQVHNLISHWARCIRPLVTTATSESWGKIYLKSESTPITDIYHLTDNFRSNHTIRDFTSQIKLKSDPVACSSLCKVYRHTISEDKGKTVEVAVKVFVVDPKRSEGKDDSAMRRELAVWLKLSRSTYIVPLLGIAKVDSPLSALVSEWMSSGALNEYIEKRATTLAVSARVELAKGVADGINYLFSENVVHGNLHPGNVLIDGSGHPRLTDFGLATVVGDLQLQLSTTTVTRELNPRWRAPEVLGIEQDLARPTFMSDIYSLGSVIFFIISGDIPWKEKKNLRHIYIELGKKATPTRPGNIPNGPWSLIQKCWSWNPKDRPSAEKVLEYIDQFGIDDLQAMHPTQREQDIPNPETSDLSSSNEIQQCLPADASARPSASMVSDFVEASTDGDTAARRVEGSHQRASSDMSDAEKTASDGVTHPTQREEDIPSPATLDLLSSNTENPQPSFGVSTSPPLGPLNVLLFGETGVDKMSIIKLIIGQTVADTSPDAPHSMLKHTTHEVNLRGRRFRLWEVSSIAPMGFFRRLVAKWQLKSSYRKLHRDGGVHLLLYCMGGPSVQRASRDYKYFTDIVSSTSGVPIAAVVNGLEGYPTDMDDWWTNNKGELERLGMQFSNHACITSLPDDPSASRSRETIRSLIESYTS
ncbi:kinase-like domain-containing protein, partial [Suillus paluster]|uniref:kinase-like domain-containing protein n=1 Tax=Suillus paluster TaxID=48578 RepID=UPI001B85EBC1